MVSQLEALALLEKLLANGFWTLCSRYPAISEDLPTVIMTLHIGGQEKRVSHSDYRTTAPGWLQSLEYEIDKLADTHQWIHGDPRKELLANVRSDGSGPKPGLTDLMRAAIAADVNEMQRLLAVKADPNAQDSSGWTALVYAAQGAKVGREDASTYPRQVPPAGGTLFYTCRGRRKHRPARLQRPYGLRHSRTGAASVVSSSSTCRVRPVRADTV
jgi:hypothetical protein